MSLSIGISHASLTKTHAAKGIYAGKAKAAAASAPAAGSAQDLIDAAQSAVDAEQYSRAIEILRSVTASNSPASSIGRDAAMLLVDTLRADGDYHGALAENVALQAALAGADPKLAAQSADILAGLAEQNVILRQQADRDDALTKSVAQATSPIRRSLAQADLLLFREKRDAAFSQYAAAVNEALASPSLTQGDVDVVSRGLFYLWWGNRRDPAFKDMQTKATAVALDPMAPQFQRLLGLRAAALLIKPGSVWPFALKVAHLTASQPGPLRDAASSLALKDVLAFTDDVAGSVQSAAGSRNYDAAKAALDQVAPLRAASPKAAGALAAQFQAVQDRRAWIPIEKGIHAAVRLEIAGDRSAASLEYKRLAEACHAAAAPGYKDAIGQIAGEAARSAQLLQMPVEPPAGAAKMPCRFLGLDPTLGSNWASALGSDAWVLFAVHGKDLAGGPKVLDGSFTYRVSNYDAANTVRRWRDPAGYASRPTADVPLCDPASGDGETAISFLDDNGENYAYGAGPDLRLDISAPAGDHLLSIPIHFSDVNRAQAHYGFSLLSNDGGAARCLASTVVGVPAAPSYLRALVSGPARYTLVVRRLDSLNANIPAIFLDPVPDAGTFPLTAEFTADELSAAKIKTDGVGVSTDQTPHGRLQALADGYGLGLGDPAVLALRAQDLAASSDLTEAQRVVAAYLAWRFYEETPLQSGKRLTAFAQFLGLRYAWISETAYSAVPGLMEDRAGRLRESGKCAYAEVVDDALWDLGLKRGRKDVTDENNPSAAQTILFQHLWKQGPEHYLSLQKVMLTTGADDPDTQSILLALDPLYASAKARLASQSLAADNPLRGLSSSPATEPVIAASTASAQAALSWLDTLALQTGVSPNGLASQLNPRAPGAPAEQPVGFIVYAAAAAPLLGGSLSTAGAAPADALPVKDPAAPASVAGAADHKSCLLRSDQLETLARAYLGREMYGADAGDGNTYLAVRTLDLLKVIYPDYKRMALIQPLLDVLRPQPKPN